MIALTENHLDDLIALAETWRVRLNFPGVVFGVAQHGQILGIRGVGYADRERQRPFTPETCVRVGSNTKSMTAALAASLIAEGHMTWHTQAWHILADFRLSDAQLTHNATLADLLSMRLGLASSDIIFDGSEMTAAQLFDVVARLPVEAPPNERMIYNNDVYAAGGLLTAMAAGYTLDDALAGYEKLLTERVLKPFGLTRAGLGSDLNRFGSDFALPYEPDARSWQAHLVGYPSIGGHAPAGDVFASTHDMLTYLLAHLEHYHTLAPEHPLRACYASHAPINGPASYGLGWALEKHAAFDVLWHNGGIDGFLSHMAFIPQAQAAFFIATNSGTGDYFVQGMRNTFQQMVMGGVESAATMEKYGQADLQRRQTVKMLLAEAPTPQHIEAACGYYERGAWIEQRKDDGVLLLHLPPRALQLYPVQGEAAFITVGLSDILRVDIVEEQNGQRMVIREFGTGEPLPNHGGWRKLDEKPPQ